MVESTGGGGQASFTDEVKSLFLQWPIDELELELLQLSLNYTSKRMTDFKGSF